MNKVEIILGEPYRGDALRALHAQGVQVMGAEFSGPVFDNASVEVSGGAAVVTPHAESMRYFYPLHTVVRIKESYVEAEVEA